MDLEIIKPQNLGSLLMKESQSNFNLRSPSSYWSRSCLIATVPQVNFPANNILTEGEYDEIKSRVSS